jgi:hypothetical protein
MAHVGDIVNHDGKQSRRFIPFMGEARFIRKLRENSSACFVLILLA